MATNKSYQCVIREDEFTISTVYELKGRKHAKDMPLDVFCKALLSGSNSAKSVTINPIGLRVHAKAGDKVIVGYEAPERVADIKFASNNKDGYTTVKSVYPWGLTFIEFNDTPQGLAWTNFFQLAMKGPLYNLDTMLYVWPGSNVYQDYRCCIGKINVPAIKSVEFTGGLPGIFYGGINNNDLSGNRFNSFESKVLKDTVSRPVHLYKHLECTENEPKPFPYDILINACTLKSFLEGKGYI